jgi:putative component of membrane protein insertase Oxa1/YidC/SpoIIIJ protein YidD
MAIAPIVSLASANNLTALSGMRAGALPMAVRFQGGQSDSVDGVTSTVSLASGPTSVAALSPTVTPIQQAEETLAGTDRNEQTGIASGICQGLIKGYQWVTRKTPIKYIWQPNAGKCSHRTIGKNEYSCSEYGLAAFQRYSPLEAFALTSLKLLTCGPHTDLTPVGALFNEPMPLKELMAQYNQLKAEYPRFYWGTDEDKATFKALKSPKDDGSECPPLRPALFNLSRLDWLRALNYADTVKPKLYDDGVINQHLAHVA